jgi:hypothetical protein
MTKCQYTFIYDYREKKELTEISKLDMEAEDFNDKGNINQLNFPIKAFYSHHYGECYVFYRQGLMFTHVLKDAEGY